MNVKELIEELKKIKDKTLEVRVIEDYDDGGPNYWIRSIEVSETGRSGYELEGEVRLIGRE